MDCIVHEVPKSWTLLSDFTSFYFLAMLIFAAIDKIEKYFPNLANSTQRPFFFFFFFFCFLKIYFIYLAALGLGCSTWDLQSSVQHVRSFVEPRDLSKVGFLTESWQQKECGELGSMGSMHSSSRCHGLSALFGGRKFSSVPQSCLTLCNPMDCSIPGSPVHYQFPEFTQTHVHWVSDGTQPSHPLSSPSPPAFNLSQHQGLFQWVSSVHSVAKVLEFQL